MTMLPSDVDVYAALRSCDDWQHASMEGHDTGRSVVLNTFRREEAVSRSTADIASDIIHRPHTMKSWVASVVHNRIDHAVRLGLTSRDTGPAQLPIDRLFLYFPDRSALDEDASILSGGLFDEDDVPGWDFWIDYILQSDFYAHLKSSPPDLSANCLVCHAPQRYYERIKDGLGGINAGSIMWATEYLEMRPSCLLARWVAKWRSRASL